jgi:hypothetical protein
MVNKLYTYALVKALYDQNRDYFDTFLPLILNITPKNSFVDIQTIQNSLDSKYNLKIPLHIIKTICNRGRSKGFLNQKNNYREYELTSNGVEYLTKQEQQQNVERRINSLIDDISQFFSSKGITIDAKATRSLLNNFIENDLEGLIDFINPQAEPRNTIPLDRKHNIILIEYIKEAQRSKPNEYSALTEMIYGSIISSVLSSKDSSEITDIENRDFKKSLIFLDTNLIFSILGLHNDEKNQSSIELLGLLKKNSFKLRVFDFTLDEICRVINGYLLNKNKYPSILDIDSIYSTLKKKGWGFSDVAEFISNIEDKIEEKGIEVYVTEGINLSDYTSPYNENLRSKISSNKIHDTKNLSTNHDLAAIDKIRDIRKRSVRKIEDIEAIFLTSDYGLQKTVLYEMNHNENGTVSEVILDRVLANILWLKNPTTDIPLNMIIANHSREFFIDRKIWDRFYSILEKLKKEEKISDDQIEVLFYQNNISNLLKEYDKDNIDKVTDKLALEAIEDAIKTNKKENQEILTKYDITKEKLFEIQSEKEKEEQAHNNRIISIKEKLRQKALSRSELFSNYLIILFILILWCGEYRLFLWLITKLSTQDLTIITNFYSGFGLLIATSIAALFWGCLRNILKVWIFKYFVKKYNNELNL